MARYRYTGHEARMVFHRRVLPGESLELSDTQAAQWPGAFVPVEGTVPQATAPVEDPRQGERPEEDLASIVAGAAVSDVLEAVRTGILDADEVLAAEQAGKGRVTLIRALEGLA
jgi:hypothetical protein